MTPPSAVHHALPLCMSWVDGVVERLPPALVPGVASERRSCPRPWFLAWLRFDCERLPPDLVPGVATLRGPGHDLALRRQRALAPDTTLS